LANSPIGLGAPCVIRRPGTAYRRSGSTATRLQSTLATGRHPSPTTNVRIKNQTDDKWRTLHEIFETQWLLDAIDEVDALRGHLSDDEHYRPPKICDDLLRLHQLAMKVVNSGSGVHAREFFHDMRNAAGRF
jgi:hypothetical protein